MSLSAFDSVHRGFVNTRANWELIFFQWLQALLAGILIVVGLLPPLAAMGFARPTGMSSWPADWPSVLGGFSSVLQRGVDSWLLLAVSLVVTTAIWLVATMVYCFFQGGIYGVLSAADRQAPSGAARNSQWFRTFSSRDFRGWGSHFMWRFFWLFNLIVLVSTIWLVLPLLLVLGSVWSGEMWGGGAGFALGCAGAIPVGFTLLTLAFWGSLAQATLVGQDTSVGEAARSGLRILGRRLGTVLFIFVVVVFGSIVASIVVSALSVLVTLVLSRWEVLKITADLLVWMIHWGISSAFGIALAAALIGLVRNESAGDHQA